MPQDDNKQCIYCAETIKAAAVICRFCNSDVSSKVSDSSLAAKRPKLGSGDLPLTLIKYLIALLLLLACVFMIIILAVNVFHFRY